VDQGVEGEAAGLARERREAEEEGRLGEGGEGHLAARPHALERAAGVERGEDGQEALQGEEVDDEDEVPLEREEGRHVAEGQEGEAERAGGHAGRGAEAEEAGRRRAVDRALAPQLEEVVVGLGDGGALPPGEERLRLHDEAGEERGEGERQEGREPFEVRHG
jgi:hypothetical protein